MGKRRVMEDNLPNQSLYKFVVGQSSSMYKAKGIIVVVVVQVKNWLGRKNVSYLNGKNEYAKSHAIFFFSFSHSLAPLAEAEAKE